METPFWICFTHSKHNRITLRLLFPDLLIELEFERVGLRILVWLVVAFLLSVVWTCYFSAWCQDCLISASSCTSLFAAWWNTRRCRGGKGPSTLCRRNLKTKISIWTLSNVFRLQYNGGILKRNNHLPLWICVGGFWFLCVFHPHKNPKLAFSNSSGSKSVFEKLHLCDRLVWTVGLSNRTKKAPFWNFSCVLWMLPNSCLCQ